MLEKLTPKDVKDRDVWQELFDVMEKQGAVGETQSLDYKNALWYRENEEAFKSKELSEGDIIENYDDIIFDFDGVLYDSTEAVYEGAKLAIEHFAGSDAHSHLSVSDVANSYHSPFHEYYIRFGIDLDNPKVRKDFYDYYQAVCYPQAKQKYPPKFYDDAISMLQKLREEKIKNPSLKIHLVSAGREDYLRERLNEIGALDIFTDMYFSAGDKKKAIGEIASKSGNPEKCIMIGDLPSDIKDAQANVGVKSVAVARGPREHDRLGHYLPDYIVSDLNGLFDLKSYSKELKEQK